MACAVIHPQEKRLSVNEFNLIQTLFILRVVKTTRLDMCPTRQCHKICESRFEHETTEIVSKIYELQNRTVTRQEINTSVERHS